MFIYTEANPSVILIVELIHYVLVCISTGKVVKVPLFIPTAHERYC